MNLHCSFELSYEEPQPGSIVFTSDPSKESTYFLVPRKLQTDGYQELSDVPLEYFKAIETQKYVDFKNNSIV